MNRRIFISHWIAVVRTSLYDYRARKIDIRHTGLAMLPKWTAKMKAIDFQQFIKGRIHMPSAFLYRHLLIVLILMGASVFFLGCEKFPESLPESHFELSDEDTSAPGIDIEEIDDIEEEDDIDWDVAESDIIATTYICEGEDAIDCDDENPCTLDSCDIKTGCVYESAETCDDNDACTLDEACIDQECTPGTQVLDCDDDNPCTDDTCDPVSGCTNQNNSLDCDDGDVCTLLETCAEGVCTSSGKLECEDEN